MLTLKLLRHFEACREGSAFVVRNKLIGLSLSAVKDIKGDHEFLIWLKNYCNVVADSRGNIVQYTYSNGLVESWKYNDNDDKIQCTFSNGFTESWKYNDNDDKIQCTFSNGFTESWKYDCANRVIEYVDQYNQTEFFQYDCAGNLIKNIFPDGSIQSWSDYDVNGNAAQHINCAGLTEFFTFNKNGLKIGHIDYDGYHQSWSYDSNENITEHTEHTEYDDIITKYEYDAAGNVTKFIRNDIVIQSNIYTYYYNGQLRSMNDIELPFILGRVD